MLRVIPVKMGIQVFSLAWILRFAYGEGVSTISDGETTFLSAILLCLLPLSGFSSAFMLHPSAFPRPSLTPVTNQCNNPARLCRHYFACAVSWTTAIAPRRDRTGRAV